MRTYPRYFRIGSLNFSTSLSIVDARGPPGAHLSRSQGLYRHKRRKTFNKSPMPTKFHEKPDVNRLSHFPRKTMIIFICSPNTTELIN